MKTFKNLVRAKLDEIQVERKILDIKMWLEEFGMVEMETANKRSKFYTLVPNENPFNFEIRVWFSEENRNIVVNLWDVDNEPYEWVFYLAEYSAEEIYNRIVELVENEVKRAL